MLFFVDCCVLRRRFLIDGCAITRRFLIDDCVVTRRFFSLIVALLHVVVFLLIDER